MSDIAKDLGISRSTVSLALQNSPKLTEATRKRVLEAAEKLGYRANPYVSALMAARRFGKEPTDVPVIALVSSSLDEDGWKDQSNLSRFIKGCRDTASRLGYETELFWIGDPAMTAKRMNEILYSRGIRGAVLMTHGEWGGKLDYDWQDLATVTFGARTLVPQTDWVSGDFYGNMEMTLETLRAQGFHRIGFVMDRPFPYEQHNRWVSAYLMEQQRTSIADIQPWLDFSPSFEGFIKWFRMEKPQVIICVHPPTVIEWLKKLNKRVPEEIGVIAIGTAEAGGPISGVVVDTGTCGKLAIEMLLDRIYNNEFAVYADPRHVTVSGQWNQGMTL